MALFDPTNEHAIAAELDDWAKLAEELFGCCRQERHLIDRVAESIKFHRDIAHILASIEALDNYARRFTAFYPVSLADGDTRASLVRRVVQSAQRIANGLSKGPGA